MAEKIISIYEVNDSEWEGYEITTDTRTIRVVIDNESACCESWGHLASEDDITQFIGADLLGVEVVDAALNTKSDPGDIDEGTAHFVNFNTDRGKFQLSVYDAHNGYYGHEVEITGLVHSEHGLTDNAD